MSDLADRTWRVIRDEPRDGATQMALEEVAGRTALEEDVRTVRVFSWEPSTLSLGYGQAPETVDWEYCAREGIDVTRRQTGGGGIYHDAVGDISYTIVAPAEEVPGDLMACYERFCEPVLGAFSRLGVEATFAPSALESIHQPSCYLRDVHPAHDVVVEGVDGRLRKVSGNAQYRRRDVVIQHGSLTYALEPERHLGCFADPTIDPATFTDRVTSIRSESGADREDAVDALVTALGEWCDGAAGEWREGELAAASELAATKYAARAWVRDREDRSVGD